MWFLVFWGRRKREKQLGCVADYCPICRKIGTFQLVEHRMGQHVWFVPVERGQLSGHSKICGSCDTESEAFLEAFREVSRSGDQSLEALITKTNPLVREIHHERLALADQLTADLESLDSTKRHRLMMEAFSLAEPHFTSGFGQQGRRILTTSLRPLLPKEEEIRACLQRYRDNGSRMGMRLHTEEVMAMLYPGTPPQDPNKFSY
jgi:hypothetical protein